VTNTLTYLVTYVAPLSAVINSFSVSHYQYAHDTQIYIAVSKADVLDKVSLLQDCTARVHSCLLTYLVTYVAPISAVINSFSVSHHQYADDTQIYIAVSKANVLDKVGGLQDCTARVHSWLQMNNLQLNPIKSEIIQFSATRGRDKVDDVTSFLVSKAVSSIRSLGVTLDRKLLFDQHFNNTCKSCYHHIRALRHIRESLPNEVVNTIACSVIDYCNGLLIITSKSSFHKLQRVQNKRSCASFCVKEITNT